MWRRGIFLFALMVCSGTWANKTIDSLKQVIATTENDSIKIEALQDWDNLIYNTDPDLDLELNLKIRDICLGKVSGDYPNYYTAGMYWASNNLGIINLDRADFIAAIESFELARNAAIVLKNPSYESGVYNNLGAIYATIKEYDSAIEYYLKAMNTRLRSQQDSSGIFNPLHNIGEVYFYKKQYDKSLQMVNHAIRLNTKPDKRPLINSLLVKGDNLQELSRLEEASKAYADALELNEEVLNQQAFARAYYSLAKLDLALNNDVNSALRNATKSFNVATTHGFLSERSKASNLLFDLYYKQGKYQDALKMYRVYKESEDTIYSNDYRSEAIKRDLQYKYQAQAVADSISNNERMALAAFKHDQELKQRNILISASAGGALLLLILAVVIFSRLRVTRKQKTIIEEQKQQVEQTHQLLSAKNQEVIDSITYAKRLQEAILPKADMLNNWFSDSFVLYIPKDIVAGDFYYVHGAENEVVFAVADCTGHGVPGAMVSVVCHNAMNRSMREFGLKVPGEILSKTRELVIEHFSNNEHEVKDGMDISLCSYNKTTKALTFSGAQNPIWVVKKGVPEMFEIKGDKQPVGEHFNMEPFKTHQVNVAEGDMIFLLSDGFADQFGGERGKKFKYRPLKQFLIENADKPGVQQHDLLKGKLISWMGNHEQIDDVCIMGVRV